MTREEAIKHLLLDWYVDRGCEFKIRPGRLDDFLAAIDVALAALRHQIWEEKLWHDAKTDPPKTPGLYYGKKDDTNSMYPCLYRDGIWVLDAYPQTKMDIVKWADYTAFVREDD